MKKLFLLSVLAVVLPASLMAQDDDMYFVPTKKNVEKAKYGYGMPRDTYYSGSNRSVDEYNRRYASMVQSVDSLGNVVPDSIGNDIIQLDGVAGVYPDSLGDYTYTRRMSRWDDYEWRDGYRAGYSDGRFGRWGWSSYYPYYSGWYGGWYDPWYDPWYYGGWGYAGWYDPWYYGGWGYPGYWHGHWHGGWYPSYGVAWGRRSTGTRNHSGGGKGYNYRRYNSVGGNRGFAGNRGNYNNNVHSGNNRRNVNFGGVRNSNGNNYQNNTHSPSRNNSSFGGTRSSGGSHGGGGGSSRGGGGGGGHFGGGRR